MLLSTLAHFTISRETTICADFLQHQKLSSFIELALVQKYLERATNRDVTHLAHLAHLATRLLSLGDHAVEPYSVLNSLSSKALPLWKDVPPFYD